MWEKKDIKFLEVTHDIAITSEKDIEYEISLIRVILTPFGIWPIESHNKIFNKTALRIRVIICYALLLFIIIPGTLHIILEVKDRSKQIKLMSTMIYYMSAGIKYSILLSKKNKILRSLNNIFADWQRISFSQDRDIMLSNVKSARFLTWLSIILIYSSSFSFHIIIPYLTKKHAPPNNITIRTLPSPVYQRLFCVTTSPAYEIAWLTQLGSSLVINTLGIGTISLVVLLVKHACGQFEIIITRLNSLVDKYEHDIGKNENQIGELIELHMKVLSFIRRFESMLNKICFVDFGASTLMICCMGYNILMTFQRNEVFNGLMLNLVLVHFIYSIFILCYSSELLIQKSKKIGYTAYMMDWYKLPNKHAKSLILLFVMSNYPCRITAGNIVDLSYISFSFVMRTSMGYLNLLRALTT